MRDLRFPAVVFAVLCLLPTAAVLAADWPQYRGPDQTGATAEKVILDWQAGGPKLLWKIPTPNGFSSFAVSGGKAYTQVNRDLDGKPREVCLALDALTGKELWSVDVGEGHYPGGGDTGAPDNSGGDGPRSTPTINDGLVYVATPNLVLYCLDASTGKQIWTKDLMKEHAGRNIGWKSAASPVIDGDLLFVGGGGPGQSLLALDKKTGKVVWKGFDEKITHATPVATTILGRRQVIFFLQSGLLSVAAEDGKALWKFPFKYAVSTAASPVVWGDVVYCGAGYNVGGAACKIARTADGFQATELWRSPGNNQVVSHWSTPVCKDGYLYGMFSFKKFGSGPLKCVEIATGKIAWEQPGFGPGNVILAGGRLLALSDDGRLVVVEATPEGYHEIARAKVLTGKCWSTPALSDGRIFVRSTKEGACLALTGG
jgi:outer membrane protein assembly factor BamB